jgi:hypothetical protein
MNFWDWMNRLTEDNFFNVENSNDKSVYFLKAPMQIKVDPEVIQRIKRRYKPNREIGGILLAEPTMIGEDRILAVKHIRFIKNQSKTPEKQYQKRGDQKMHLHKCLCGRKDNKRYIPICFHSHPRQSTGNVSELLMTFLAMSTSDADKKNATREITYEVDFHDGKTSKIAFKFPSALAIVSIESYLFIGIYGGLIAPDDFKAYIQKLLSRSTKDVINWGGNSDSFWAFLASTIAAVGLGVLSTGSNNPLLRALAAQTALLVKDQKTDHNYFSICKDAGELKIIIP